MEKRISTRLPRIERTRSAVHGYGVFIAEAIAKNTRVINYAGQLRNGSELDEGEEEYLKQGCIWVFRVNRVWSRDANVGGTIARFNQSFGQPTNDYRTIGDKTIPCQCRPGCPNRL
jgi:hypothetical protein